MKLKRVPEIFKCLVFSFPVARHINLDALGDELFIFLPDAGSESLFHIVIPCLRRWVAN